MYLGFAGLMPARAIRLQKVCPSWCGVIEAVLPYRCGCIGLPAVTDDTDSANIEFTA